MKLFLTWLMFYLAGLAGMYVHILMKATKEIPVRTWIEKNSRAVTITFISYNLLIFMWVTTGLEFFGLVKGVPHGLTIVIGYSANEFFASVMKQWTSKFGIQAPPDPSGEDPKQ